MNRKERLGRTYAGKTVDRPPVSFYEIDGFTQNPHDSNPYNIYSDPSWQPLLQLAREKTDVIASTHVPVRNSKGENINLVPDELAEVGTEDDGKYRITKTTIRHGNTILTSRTMRDKDIDTTWVTEHLLKNTADLMSWLDLPFPEMAGEICPEKVMELEAGIGDAGGIMLNTPDPLCAVAALFEMGDYTVIAMTEQDLFTKALEKAAVLIEWKVDMVARAFPGRLWRIFGPEYASEPYLPPELFDRYVTGYNKRLVEIIHRHGGYARLHSHGNLKNVLDYIVDTGCMGLDPIEPPPQGDVELAYVRKNYGQNMVLFGNLEASDLENLPEDKFREKIKRAISEGTSGEGRGFVLMPSSSPYGRKLSITAMKNYEAMVDEIEKI
jgi:hypothetical protein